MIAETASALNATTSVRKSRSMQWSEAEFEALFLEHYSRIVGVLLRLLGERTRAEELANDVFWKLYRTPDVGEVDGRVGGWLYRTATNLGIDALRAAARRRKYEDAAARTQEGAAAASPLDDMVRAEQRRRVREVLAAIRPAQAQVLILRASGFSYKELADVLELKPGGIGTMLSRAQAEFRKAYVELHGKEEEL
ncbi:MAG TPA: sigma-70 family RNA polymerase sigma factor [Terriglobales bacterium]|nr:sigma-70 family RNA polymerase sigma factor [Terriglobales bacterium]